VSLQDTLYVLADTYIEVRLNEQMLYQYFRNDSVYAYPISTGDTKQPRAIATREGIFSIKWKARKHVSSIFDVPMYFWMPFDGGIGLHALSGNNYYWYLGNEPSSHGCVRMSREGAEEVYDVTPTGTAVIVHSGTPARVLEFGDTTRMPDLRVMEKIETELLQRRLTAVEEGRADDPSLRQRLALPAKVFQGSIDVGALQLSEEERAAMKRTVVPPELILPTETDVK
jgi:hypothetical protein